MTDTAIQPLNPQEQAAIITAETNRLLNEITAGLEMLHTESDAARRFELAEACWTKVGELGAIVEESAYLVGIATEVMAVIEEQRNAAVAELEILTEALYDQDESHPIVGRAIEDIREQEQYEAQMDAWEGIGEAAFENTIRHARELLGIENYEVRAAFALALAEGFKGYGTNVIPDAVWAEIGAFISERLSPYVER